MGNWVWYLGAGVLGAGALWLFVWAWWGDRSRGRARCGRCWYPLDALMDGGDGLPVCPECGWKAKRRRQLFKSRRRMWWAAAAVVLTLGAVATGLTPKVQRDGAWSVAPGWFMRAVVRNGVAPRGGFGEEYVRRGASGNEWGVWARAAYDGSRSARVTRDEWVAGYPLRVRSQGFFIKLGVPVVFMLGDESVPDEVSDPGGESHENWWWCARNVFAPRAAGDQPYHVTVRAVANEADCTFEQQVPVRASPDEVLTAVELSRGTLLRVVKPSVFVLPTAERLALSVADVSASDVGEGVALGVRAELVLDGVVIGTARWHQGAGSDSVSGFPIPWYFSGAAGEKAPRMPMSLDEMVARGCVVRFSTDVEMALSAFDYDKYWKGSFEVPLAELVK